MQPRVRPVEYRWMWRGHVWADLVEICLHELLCEVDIVPVFPHINNINDVLMLQMPADKRREENGVRG